MLSFEPGVFKPQLKERLKGLRPTEGICAYCTTQASMTSALNASATPPKFSFAFVTAAGSSCGNFRIAWLLVGSEKHLSVSPGRTTVYANSTVTLTPIVNGTRAYLGSGQAPAASSPGSTAPTTASQTFVMEACRFSARQSTWLPNFNSCLIKRMMDLSAKAPVQSPLVLFRLLCY